jgi:hypothetical protein
MNEWRCEDDCHELRIPEQRAAAHDTLKRLRAERSDAILANRAFDHSQIASIEQTLVALDEAEEEAERRQAAARRVAATEWRKEALVRLAELEEGRLAAVASFGEAAKALTAAIGEVRQRTAAVDKLAASLQPASVTGPEKIGLEVEMRLSGNLSAEMRRVIGGVPRYGAIALPPPSHAVAPTDWTAEERRRGKLLMEVCRRPPEE